VPFQGVRVYPARPSASLSGRAGSGCGVTSVEIPTSIAAALPTLSVLDITNDVSREVVAAGRDHGIAYVSPGGDGSLVRVQERESGFFCDLEDLLTRLVPMELAEREKLLTMLLGPSTEQIPFADGLLCLGTYQRIFVFGFGSPFTGEWRVTLLG
jgi:thiamine phosphate synthase YjbQ (UPF0047 family)